VESARGGKEEGQRGSLCIESKKESSRALDRKEKDEDVSESDSNWMEKKGVFHPVTEREEGYTLVFSLLPSLPTEWRGRERNQRGNTRQLVVVQGEYSSLSL
jgi:hypothetical protein